MTIKYYEKCDAGISDADTPAELARRRFIGILAFLPFFTACADRTQPPTPPLVLPFEVQKVGSKVETELRIVKRRQYVFSLQFRFNKNDAADRARVKKLVGEDGQFKNGDPGISTPLRFKISVIDAEGERPMLEQEISELRLRSWGSDCFDKHIDYVMLEPGYYRISVESLKAVPELDGTLTAFVVTYSLKN